VLQLQAEEKAKLQVSTLRRRLHSRVRVRAVGRAARAR
jgi:hypothetical protein